MADLVDPDAETASIARLQPYDPNKTVVLVIHGLMDSQATWTPMLNRLRGDADIRRNYQFWFYSYPSGYPYPYSASILRHELDGIEKRFPLQKKMVVIGHSMGGCISRLLITDTDEKLWMMKAINTIPITPGIPYHTIMGDRGRGDAPNSSNGVVPYWSSHMDGAKSELIVPSAHQNPQAIAEVNRIFELNARSNDRSSAAQ